MTDKPAYASETDQRRRPNRDLSMLNAITEALHLEVDLEGAANINVVTYSCINDLMDGTDDLHIAERTVKFHVTSILTKLHADNRTQAVAIAAQRGLIDLHFPL